MADAPDPRDVEKVADAIRGMDWSGDAPSPDAIAEVALTAMQSLPRRAQVVRASRNG